MNKNILIGILVVIVILVGGYAIWKTVATPTPVVQVVDSQNPTLNPIPQTTPVQTNAQNIPVTPSTSTTNGSVAVNGMTKYTDTNIGYSFWYPSTWTVNQIAVANPNIYAGGTVSETLNLSDQSGTQMMTVSDFSSPTASITDNAQSGCPGGQCSPTLQYYFNFSRHIWMVGWPLGFSSDGASSVAAGTTSAADISVNTMGGLHMFKGGFNNDDIIVPLSADNFVIVTDNTNDVGPNFKPFLVKTIVAANPAVATPVSAAQQVQTIQAELAAYATNSNQQTNQSSNSSPSWQSYTDPTTGITVQYPSLNGASLQPSIQVTPSTGVDSNGCVPSDNGITAHDSLITLNGIHFCESISDDSGMGATGTVYDYTFLNGGTYYTLAYEAVTHDCSDYDSGTSGYQTCENTDGSINSLVQYIQQSLSTLSI